MTRVEELQEIERLTTAYLAEDDAVWAMAEGSFQEVTNAYCRQAVLWLEEPRRKLVLYLISDSGLRSRGSSKKQFLF